MWTKQDNKVITSASCALTSLSGGTIQAHNIVKAKTNTLWMFQGFFDKYVITHVMTWCYNSKTLDGMISLPFSCTSKHVNMYNIHRYSVSILKSRRFILCLIYFPFKCIHIHLSSVSLRLFFSYHFYWFSFDFMWFIIKSLKIWRKWILSFFICFFSLFWIYPQYWLYR